MQNAELDKAQAGIKISRRNINNLRYADDNTLMAESEEERKSLLMKVKEESEKAGLKLNIKKMKIMASGPYHFMANRWGNNGNSDRLSFLGLQIIADGDCSHETKRLSLLGRNYEKPRQYIKKQTHYFPNKDPSSQSYSFHSSHVRVRL